MWMGMTTRKTSLAVFKTICFVIVLPAIALSFGQGIMMTMLMLAKWPFWLSIAMYGVSHIAKNIFFIFLARHRLLAGFRDAMLRDGRHVTRVLPPPPLSQPPLMSAGSSAV